MKKLRFSPIVEAAEAGHSGNFSVFRLDLRTLSPFITPVMGFDHYRMSGPTFAPHPHAGFSAVSYVFENSEGSLRNRDSLGDDMVVDPGDLLWTQAGSGVIHDEFPVRNGATVEGLQLFVNLSQANKQLAPRAFHAKAAQIPVFQTPENRIRILSGELGGFHSPVTPAEPFDFFDARLSAPWIYSIRGNQNVLVYVLSGSVTIGAGEGEHTLGKRQAVGLRPEAPDVEVHIQPQNRAHLLLLSGQDSKDPVVVYGSFIMNTQAQIAEAIERYQNGQMGRL
jgi:redox-sensitive bicupin YhaK (pirin superfamily)